MDERVETGRRVDEVVVVITLTSEVLAPEAQTRVACEAACTVGAPDLAGPVAGGVDCAAVVATRRCRCGAAEDCVAGATDGGTIAPVVALA